MNIRRLILKNKYYKFKRRDYLFISLVCGNRKKNEFFYLNDESSKKKVITKKIYYKKKALTLQSNYAYIYIN